MQSINKKGLSSVIATVLILLITVAAFTILSASVLKLVRDPSLSPKFSCFDLQFNRAVTVKSACYNQTSKEAEIVLQRFIDKDLEVPSLKFVINSDSHSSSWDCSNSCSNCRILDAGRVKKYYFPISNLGTNGKVSITAPNCLLDSKVILESC